MNNFLTILTMVAFCASPAAFGAGSTAEQLYKDAYISLKQGKDKVETLRTLIAQTKKNNVEMKDVLEAAVAKGWMSQEQFNTILDVAAKNTHLADAGTAEKLAKGQLTEADLQALTGALQGQVTGASYYCGYYGCYYEDAVGAYIFVTLMLIAIILSPVTVVWTL